MEPDYEKLGLKVGLEIHQQLAAGHKLFCNCPIKKSEEFPVEARRKMRPVAGEMSAYDPAALYEFLRDRLFEYRSNPESSCLVELDEDPPRAINENALKTVLQVCKLLDCEILDEIYVMRKAVIDGSSPSGFQRTALIGINGSIKTAQGGISIPTVCLEEDSAPALSREGGKVEYRLDRLGVPLIEIATSPDIHSPKHAREVAEHIGMLLRSVSVVRGIGSIRQDINVSIAGGERIEIKGFQELDRIPEAVDSEVKRQRALLQIRGELHRRGSVSFKEPIDVTAHFRDTKNNFIRKAMAEKGRILAVVLPEFAGMLKQECGDRTFGRELSSYAAAYGYGIMHSDEDLGRHELDTEFSVLGKELSVKERDLILIIVGKAPEKAAKAVLDRARHCLIGVPKETRAADGIGSKYTRPLPGSERMYPETDVAAVPVKALGRIGMPITLFEREKELARIMPKDLAAQLVRSPELALYDEIIKSGNDPIMVATTLLSTMKDLRRNKIAVDNLGVEKISALFSFVKNKKIAKEALPEALTMLAAGGSLPEVEKRFSSIGDGELKQIISSIIEQNTGKPEAFLMGAAMKRLRGRVPGERVMRALREMLKYSEPNK